VVTVWLGQHDHVARERVGAKVFVFAAVHAMLRDENVASDDDRLVRAP
jgi:hypothetical protein